MRIRIPKQSKSPKLNITPHRNAMSALSFFTASSSSFHLGRSPNALFPSSSSSPPLDACCDVKGMKFPSSAVALRRRKRRRTTSCDVALRSDSALSTSAAAASSSVETLQEDAPEAVGKIGARIRVKVPLKVYHVPRVPELDLTGMEGVVKQYVGVWKGKRISANLPFKIEFVVDIEGRGPVKFSAHLKPEEFDYVDDS